MKTIKGNQGTSCKKAVPTGKPVPERDRSVVRVAAKSEADMDAAVARTLTRPEVCSAAVLEAWNPNTHDVNVLAAELATQVKAVNDGDTRRAEAMLIAQAHTLDAIFANLMRRAMNQNYLKQWETYMRIGLKAQSQCRTTLQALAELKNPRPVAFVKQANISHGPQQVNNGQASLTSTHAGNNDSEQSKLLEDNSDGRTYLELGATATATGGHPALEAVGAVHRSEEPRRQGAG